ncbi:MAG: dihydrofolate reductase [Chlorobi bacterium]|nr:dihydrofolate reductase [Chlorobiota bacterium]
MKRGVSLVVAAGRRGEIGKKGDLIWRISDDLKHFKALTTGGVVIMGRKTYESIGRPLPGRINIVITRREDYPSGGIFIARSPEDALRIARCFDKPIYIIGGAEVYQAFLPHADTLYLTAIDAQDPEADTFFPLPSSPRWIREEAGPLKTDPSGIPFRFEIWRKGIDK